MARVPDFKVDRMLDLAAELEIDGIDWVGTHGHTAEKLKARCDAAGLPVSCYTFFFNDIAQGVLSANARDSFKRELETALILGTSQIMIPTPGCGVERNTYRQQWISGFSRVMPMVLDTGLSLSVENFPGTDSPFVTAEDFLEAKRKLPELMLTFDSGNCFTGEDPVDSYERCSEDVNHAHFKDYTFSSEPTDGYRRMLSGNYYAPALLGEGSIDFTGLLKAMKDADYSGYISIEYGGTEYHPHDAARKAIAYLRGRLSLDWGLGTVSGPGRPEKQ
jgi:sugar phosphate isomerase/epimerase